MKKTLIALLLIVCAGTYLFYNTGADEFIPEVSTISVTEGDIVDAVGATGTLEAVTTVQVGSQVSGIIQELNVDFNSIVRQNDVIMRLDPSLFEIQIEQSKANLLRSEAEVERLRVAADDASAQLKRADELAERELISETELEAAQVAVRSTEAQIRSAEAQVTQAQATLNQNQVNLEHTVIRAPIDGIVISRLVDIGQTVAASFQAPELFAIAADLTKMRVIANIDESDVGRIRPQQTVTFTVDAFPDETFTGTVSQVRLEPVVQQNVVTYATVIDAPNAELKLKPGMTATVEIEIARRDNVLQIPNSALRFTPTPEMFAALSQPVPRNLTDANQRRQQDSELGVTAQHSRTSEFSPSDQNPETNESGPASLSFRPNGMDPERRQRMRERIQSMSEEEREEFFQRMRARRRQNNSSRPPFDRGRGRQQQTPPSTPPGNNVPAVERGAATIDALFAPLQSPRRPGRVWVWNNGQLSSVDITLGVSDGLVSELLSVTLDITTTVPNDTVTANQTRGELEEQLSRIKDETARLELQNRLAAITLSDNQNVSEERAVTNRLRTITQGTLLATNISTPDITVALDGGLSSPLIPQFPFGRRSSQRNNRQTR